jgi:H+/Na+-translocating ferredoxin:NAD+ oxidoreductase subunit C
MKYLLYRQIDHDFAGGIYLTPLGEIPPLGPIEPMAYDGDLFLPLTAGKLRLESVVESGQRVGRGELLAQGEGGNLYAPRAGVVGEMQEVWSAEAKNRRAITLRKAPTDEYAETNIGQVWHERQYHGAGTMLPSEAAHPAVWEKIEQAGIVVAETGQTLASRLKDLEQQEEIRAVVANATPMEPTLNTPLAILQRWSEQVFAGLAILKTWLGAQEAIMAYPHDFELDTTPAQTWQVRCVPVSEKYPQGQPGSVLRTLEKQRQLPRRRRHKRSAVVFSIQLLRQVERAILGDEKPTERIITVCGDGVAQPGHFHAPLGLPVRELLEQAGMYPDAECVVAGSSLTGTVVEVDTCVVTPTSEAFMVIQRNRQEPSQTCIRCGWCIDDCPVQIDPARLQHLAETGQFRRARRFGVETCLECGICSYVCPSRLRIREHIQMIKQKLREDPEK